MKNGMAALLCVAIGAGCATTDELIDKGERSEHLLQRPPDQAIACMSRNLERERQHAQPIIRALDGGGTELVVQTMLVAQARPAAPGARVTIWLRPQWFYRRAEIIPALINGC